MPGDYAVLAPIYDELGMSTFAARMIPRLVDFAQRNEWMGRRILDLGCGTGAVTDWFGNRGYPVVSVDESAEMLSAAQVMLARNIERPPAVRWLQQDIRNLSGIDTTDLVVALNVMNELNTLGELETVFKNVYNLLAPERMFFFDMHTIEGLAQRGAEGQRIAYDDSNRLTVFTRSDYDYERQVQTSEYLVFRQSGTDWQRQRARITLRGFPVQAVASLLQRNGLTIVSVLDSELNPYEVGTSRSARVFFFARR